MHRILSYRSLLVATAIALAPLAVNAQATAAVTCKDGTTSSATGRGACSGHGGVDKSAAKSAKRSAKTAKADTKAEVKADTKEAKKETKAAARETRPAEKSTSRAVTSDVRQTNKVANATAANTDPTNATAKCKDGTYSHAATHRGACSRHGGVAEWLKS
jgi:type IV secretory pathway TrbL component